MVFENTALELDGQSSDPRSPNVLEPPFSPLQNGQRLIGMAIAWGRRRHPSDDGHHARDRCLIDQGPAGPHGL